MEKDAVAAGVSHIGGLFSVAEVRILICYIFSVIDKPVPAQELGNTLHHEGIANYFEVIDSLAQLVEGGHIKLYNEKDNTYVITESGRDIAETLKTSISITVKKRAYNVVLKMVSRFHNIKETKTEITHEGSDTYITCSTVDNNKTFMSIKLLATDTDQALAVKEKFLENPSKIYSTLIELLTAKD